ncbi:hypothetical protein ACB368_27095 [Escherichia coli]
MFAGKKSAQIREILISESAWEEMTCLFAPSLAHESQNVVGNNGFLGSVARPGEFPIAMCDRGTWQIIYNLRELTDFYNSIGARIKETWIENGERVFQETSNGMVRLGRRRCTITY